MNYPAASRGVSSSALARHSVLDTESSRASWIPASAGMTNTRQAAGYRPSTNETVEYSCKTSRRRIENSEPSVDGNTSASTR